MQQITHFSKIYVLESLPTGDRRTGKLILEDIDAVNVFHQRKLLTELLHAMTRSEFLANLAHVQSEASQGEYPILHIECHGSQDKTGIILGDGSFLSWSELKPFLTSINVATKCNLLVVLGACYGGHLGQIILPTEPAPCWGIIGPTETIYPDELLSSFNAFYSELLGRLDGDKSLAALFSNELCFGGYHFITAFNLFKEVYAKFCTDAALDERVSRQLRKTGSDNLPGKSALKRRKRRLKKMEAPLLEKYYQRFFMIDLFPENASRFSLSLEDISALKGTLNG